MITQLTQNQLDLLQRHLIVPVAVSDILHHDLTIESDMQYGLHMALSEIDPDSALLAIALCTHHLSKKCSTAAPIAAALQKESNDIIKEYGPTWLHYYNNAPMPTEDFEKTLETVPEDLEALADLTDALCAELDNNNSTAATLANLLSIQARAHMEIADYILAEIEFEKMSGDRSEGDAGSTGREFPAREVIDMEAYTGSNIIVFPGTARN